MEITDVRVKLINDASERLKAVCTVTFDGEFVVRDIKVVEGDDGFFVAMPSRKLTGRCSKCGHKNQLRARHCEDCGVKLPNQEIPADSAGRTRLYRDTAHPITPAFREKLQAHVVEAYQQACDVALEESEAAECEKEVTDSAPEAEEAPVDETPADETPADGTPADESVVEETPADESLVEETSVDETSDADEKEDEDEKDEKDEKDDEPVDEDAETDEPVAGPNDEYNSLIAGLKGGAKSNTSTGRSDDRSEGKREPRSERGRRGGRGGRGKEQGEKKPDRAAKADDKVDDKTDKKRSERKSSDRKSSERKPVDKREKRDVESTKPFAPKEQTVAKEQADTISVSRVAEEVPVTQDVNDDSAPFGMGL